MSKKRILIYLVSAFFIIFSIIFKQNVVTEKRNKKIVSTYSEWHESGKPVAVKTVVKGNAKLFTKITVVPVSGGEYEGYVPRNIKEKLSSGQDVVIKGDDAGTTGKVVFVADTINVDTGMFQVKLTFPGDFHETSGRPVVYIHTGSYSNVICVPNDVFDKKGDDYLLWVVEDGRAHQRIVQVRERNGYGAIIREGLKEGDWLIVQGFTQISENDKLNILNMTESGEI